MFMKVSDNKLNHIIKESVHSVLNEYLEKDYGTPLYRAAKKHLDVVGIVKNEWLIHAASSDNVSKKIMQFGFSNGLSKKSLTHHSLTWADGEHEDNGYSWAFKASEFIESNQLPWGTSILFQANGIEYYNDVDCENQVIFYGKTAYNKILIYEWDGLDNSRNKYENFRENIIYGVGNINGKPLYVGDFKEVVQWCIDNFHQYRKQLLSNKEILHCSDLDEKGYEDYLDSIGYGELPLDSVNMYKKWSDEHHYDEDYANYNNKMKEAYEKFLEDNKEKVDSIKSKVKECATIIRKSFSLSEKELDKYLQSLQSNLMDEEHLGWRDFIQDYQKNHKFYMRYRKDGNLWKYNK